MILTYELVLDRVNWTMPNIYVMWKSFRSKVIARSYTKKTHTHSRLKRSVKSRQILRLSTFYIARLCAVMAPSWNCIYLIIGRKSKRNVDIPDISAWPITSGVSYASSAR